MSSGKIVSLLLYLSLSSEFMAAFSFQQQRELNSSLRSFDQDRKNYGHIQGINRPGQPVKLQIQADYVVLDNGILQVNISKPQGSVTGIQYHGIDNLLEILNRENDRGYWDIDWTGNGTKGKKGDLDRLEGTNFGVIVQNPEQVEISFTRKWSTSLAGEVVPLNIDKRYVMLQGSSGFFTYAIYEHLVGLPEFDLDNTRIAFKLRKDKFQYMAVSHTRQRFMPLPDDRETPRGQPLAYPEAVLLVNPIEPEFKGEVDDKYQYSCESRDLKVHGWISTDQLVGFWQITPSNEFRTGGPLKQFLTSHVGPTCLTLSPKVLHSTHYEGAASIIRIEANEPWKKVYGPVFTYLNSASNGPIPASLWDDAKKQAQIEVRNWPYAFVASEDYPKSSQRGSVQGRMLVLEGNVELSGSGAYVGLAVPGEVGSWQIESKGYQFWAQTDKNGGFLINNVRPGVYNLYAWVPGFIGDYKLNAPVNISSGSVINVGEIVYVPPRNGPTIWEIGIPDRTAVEFYIPAPNPHYINKLYLHFDRFRQYGLWERYAELYPIQDLVFTVGTSNYSKDWFFAQVTRKKDNITYEGTTWQIKFNLQEPNKSATYKLHLALATANNANLEVRINNPNATLPLFATGMIGKDNAIARHGIHGVYRLFSVEVAGAQLLSGNNTIFLTQAANISPFQGLMYDYIRFEGPVVH
ncbi:hypothetical protein K2173_007982 [Erythroxylum novogranatense]|uniref:rhamnogalacturonan endolyase n=1 Tax=Erythroxylum novogranatense TaxID=1862640 RepID=A0AAV8T8I6_9ROSI|nr:hypothetical protein K2173_007982 [Erythroxylum novogranatense]